MKRLRLLTTLLCVFVFHSLNAQNWKPITKSDKYNYIKDSTYYSVWADSVKSVNGDSVFFLNRVLKKVRLGDMKDPFYSKGYYLENQSQFFLNEMIYAASGDVIMKENDTVKFVLKPLAKLNDTWIFDSLKKDTARVVSQLTKTVLGNVDSVKIITLSTSMDTIVLSKNFGVLKFPIHDSTHQYVTIVGIEGRNIGLKLPKFKDIFDFKVGDVFYYYRGHFSRLFSLNENKKITIKKRTETTNSITYNVSFTSKTTSAYIGIYDTIYKSTPDSIIVFNDDVNGLFNKYTGQPFDDYVVLNDKNKPVTVFTETKFEVISKSFPYDIFCKGNGDTIVQTVNPHLCGDAHHNITYGNGLGFTSILYNSYLSPGGGYSETEQLIGYIRDGKQIGIIIDDSIFLSIPQHSKASSFNIFPNPTNSNFTIESLSNKGKGTVSIYTITGDELLSQQFQGDKTTIDISNFAKGVYIVKLITDQAIDVVKIVRE